MPRHIKKVEQKMPPQSSDLRISLLNLVFILSGKYVHFVKTFALFCVRFYSPDRRIALFHIYRSFPTAGNERTWKLTSSASVVF